MFSVFPIVGLLFFGCGSSDSCTSNICGNIEAEILAYSDCGGFVDRNSSFTEDKTYVEYELDKKNETLTIAHYNVTRICEDNTTSIKGVGWSDRIYFSYHLPDSHGCFCQRDIKTKLKFKNLKGDYRKYPVRIRGKYRSGPDPEISFEIDINKNSTGIVSFAKTN